MSQSRVVAVIFSISLLLLAGGNAFGKETVAENARLLGSSKDFRLRTQAALALGASGDKSAVAALCNGLNDENRTVRIASSSALSRLALGGQNCLQRRLAKEADELVKTSIQRSLEDLGGKSGAGCTASTRFYVAVDKLAGPKPWEAAFQRALRGSAGEAVAFAPSDESLASAAKLLAKFPAVKGFSLAFKVSTPEYTGDQMALKLSVVIMSYPGKSILGSFSQKGAITGLSAPDPAAEQELFQDLAAAAMNKFLTLAPNLDE